MQLFQAQEIMLILDGKISKSKPFVVGEASKTDVRAPPNQKQPVHKSKAGILFYFFIFLQVQIILE